MSTRDKSVDARKAIERYIAELDRIFVTAREEDDYQGAYQRISRWKERVSDELGRIVHPRERQRLKELKKGSFIRVSR
jgi:hypothetical protein